MENANLKYLVDSFNDLKIVRYDVPNWNTLTKKQKEYAYYLSEAGKCGIDITWKQFSKHGLLLRKTLENIIKTYSGDKNSDDYALFINYAKRVFFSKGVHHHYGKHKFFPECNQKYFKDLLENSSKDGFFYISKMEFKDFSKFIINIIYDKDTKSGDLIETSETCFYENVTEKEAKKFYEILYKNDKKESLSYGLNSKLIKEHGRIKEEFYKEDGLYGNAIKRVNYWLNKALEVAETKSQIEYTKILIEYFKTGDLKLWDDYNIKWVLEEGGIVDYSTGFIETYDDPIGYKGTYESVVNIKDDEATKITKIISGAASWFEENSPIDKEFKKDSVVGISAKVINAVSLSGDSYPASPIGINLPNAEWIREKHGSKSVTIGNLIQSANRAALENPTHSMGEFTYDKSNLREKLESAIKGDDLHTHLHECLGHGSGKLLPGVRQSDLGEYFSPLEEARADLFSLYYMTDKKMIELNIIDDFNIGYNYYENYIKNGLLVQLARVELGSNIKQAHMRARKLISEWAYEKGKKDKIIEKIIENKKTYFVINNYEKLRTIFGEMLKEVQKIKSTGNYSAGKDLIEKYAVKVDKKLHKEVLNRYRKLNLKPYTGWINVNLIPIIRNGKIEDVKLEYEMDFLKQQLEYGEKYSFLD